MESPFETIKDTAASTAQINNIQDVDVDFICNDVFYGRFTIIKWDELCIWSFTINVDYIDKHEYKVCINLPNYGTGEFISESLTAIYLYIISEGKTKIEDVEDYDRIIEGKITTDSDRDKIVDKFAALGYMMNFKLIENGVTTRELGLNMDNTTL